MARRLLTLFIVFLALFVVVSATYSQTVVSRTRVSSYGEGSAYVSTGTWEGNIVVLDGWDVFAFPLQKPKKGPGFTKAFDVKGLPFVRHVNGVAYIPQDKIFVFTEGPSPTTLFLSDSSGKSLGTIEFQYPNGYLPDSVEGIAYIPPDAPVYPDHFVIATARALTAPFEARLEVVDRSGQVATEIIPQDPLNPGSPLQDTLGGVEYLPGGTLLCGFYSNLVEYTFEGEIIRVVPFPESQGFFEGITRLPDGSFAGVGYQYGTLSFFDASLQRTPALDRSFLFPPGISDVSGLAWKGETNQYLMYSWTPPLTWNRDPGVWGMSSTLDTAAKLFDIPWEGNPFPLWNQYRHMVYMPDEHLLAILYRQNNSEGSPPPDCLPSPPGCILPHADIHLYDNSGNLVNIIHVRDVSYPSRGVVPGQLAYVPSLRQFVIRQNNPDGTGTPYALFISRDTGAVVRTIDLTDAGMTTGFGAVTYFNDGTDKLLFTANRRRMVVTGLGGVQLQEFDPRTTLSILNPGVISIGPTPGTFVVVDHQEWIVFSVAAAKKKK